LPGNRQDIDDYAGPGHPVARRLKEADEVGGFVVIETPGHSPGHVSYWRESDRVLIVGDVIRNFDIVTGEIGLKEPLDIHTLDPSRNRDSIRRLGALDPLICCFGHGPALIGSELLHRFIDQLPNAAVV
jgi:glyoxylase-like metal-dependent hydrolase (beta-lactamase superfamily II)